MEASELVEGLGNLENELGDLLIYMQNLRDRAAVPLVKHSAHIHRMNRILKRYNAILGLVYGVYKFVHLQAVMVRKSTGGK